ncbi:hypothetical protein BT96DRAFT_995756 [Gymnopus androsaceus JB14]|uniref:Uncharacterized protein n=1 Tax=Gymnopus androsaceus JB14 TaxID=1447944 RepID=A0A6A4HHM3_9AGAR|nr:hypothetical protein BT96DRAFT_995756 [Gymnopus androsaceus JB14]
MLLGGAPPRNAGEQFYMMMVSAGKCPGLNPWKWGHWHTNYFMKYVVGMFMMFMSNEDPGGSFDDPSKNAGTSAHTTGSAMAINKILSDGSLLSMPSEDMTKVQVKNEVGSKKRKKGSTSSKSQKQQMQSQGDTERDDSESEAKSIGDPTVEANPSHMLVHSALPQRKSGGLEPAMPLPGGPQVMGPMLLPSKLAINYMQRVMTNRERWMELDMLDSLPACAFHDHVKFLEGRMTQWDMTHNMVQLCKTAYWALKHSEECNYPLRLYGQVAPDGLEMLKGPSTAIGSNPSSPAPDTPKNSLVVAPEAPSLTSDASNPSSPPLNAQKLTSGQQVTPSDPQPPVSTTKAKERPKARPKQKTTATNINAPADIDRTSPVTLIRKTPPAAPIYPLTTTKALPEPFCAASVPASPKHQVIHSQESPEQSYDEMLAEESANAEDTVAWTKAMVTWGVLEEAHAWQNPIGNWTWWSTILPEWREQDLMGRIIPQGNGDGTWEGFEWPAQMGMLSILVALCWWYLHSELDGERADCLVALGDVVAVMEDIAYIKDAYNGRRSKKHGGDSVVEEESPPRKCTRASGGI